MDNKVIADMLDEIASMLSLEEISTSSRFEVRAYQQKAALTRSYTSGGNRGSVQKGGVKALMGLPGVGKGIASSIEEL